MTAKRQDNHSTEFGLWLREQEEIDSSLGFVATNIDYMWKNYKTGDWMLIEEKRYNSNPKYAQRELFLKINSVCEKDPQYHGLHLVTFEKTGPEDGKIFYGKNKGEISRDELLFFLKHFRFPDSRKTR